jgi:hypothetical protein
LQIDHLPPQNDAREPSLPKPSVLVQPPAVESTFHMMKLAANFSRDNFSPLENNFCIAKIIFYLIEN